MNVNIILPHTITLITTHRCTSSCPNCGFKCSPEIKNQMREEDIYRYIDKVTSAFSSIKTIVFTGGEVSLLGVNVLSRCINYAREKGIENIRIVTNAVWAKTPEKAKNYLDILYNNGLTELNISTGDEHATFTSLDKIFIAIDAFIRSDLKSLAIAIEKTSDSQITADVIINEFREKYKIDLSEQIEGKKILLLPSNWIVLSHFKTSYDNSDFTTDMSYRKNIVTDTGCKSILNSIQINPNGQLLSCCGFAAEFSSLLKMGNIDSYSNMKEEYEGKLYNILRLWLYAEGPEKIIEHFEEKGTLKTKNTHQCEHCIRLVGNRKYIEKIIALDSSKILDICYKYNLKSNF